MSEYYKQVTVAEGGGTKAIVSIPAWAQALHEGAGTQKDTITTPALAHAYVPLVYRAVGLRCDALVSVPIHFTKLNGETEVEWPFPDVDLKDLLWKTEAALILHGASYIEKIPRLRSNKTGGLQWVNPLTMNARLIPGENNQRVYEFQQGDRGAKFSLDTMIYMRMFSLLGEMTANGSVLPGDSPAKVALNDAALIRYMSRFAARFFEGGAMPITLGSIEGLIDTDEIKRTENFFKRAMIGVRNAFRVLFTSRAIDIKTISQPLKDLAMPELNAQARHAVSLAFGIPQTMLEDAANFATSQEHRLSFWQDAMRPRGEWLAEQFNRQLLNKMGMRMYFGFEELDVFQADESERAESLNTIVTAINTNPQIASWAMSVLGYDLTDDQEKELAEIIKKKEEETPPTPPPAQPVTEQAPPAQQQPEPPAKSAWADDLSRWTRKAERVFGESGSAACEYLSDVIPDGVRQDIERRLPDCKSVEDIRGLFKPHTRAVPEPDTDRSCDPGALALAESINGLAAVYLKSMTATPAPQPNINVTLPPITMTANMPEQREPSITFSPVIEAKAAEQPAPQVVVNVPEQPAPVVQNTVNVDVPEQAAPVVNVTNDVQPAEVKVDMPKPKRERQKVKRNKNTGLIESTDTTIEYEE